MKTKNKKIIFICQVSESALKVIKCLRPNSSKIEFMDLNVEEAPPNNTDNKTFAERLTQAFHKLGYSHNPIVISLPRNKVTTRYLKIPTQVPSEIEKIISLQASAYLPYPANELITGYQIISTADAGDTYINLIIAHKDIIERYIAVVKELRAATFTLTLSSYGLLFLYNYINPREEKTVMVIDIDYSQAELAIINQKKLIFSRYFNISPSQGDWQNLFIAEINATRDAYLKEVSRDTLDKIAIIDDRKTYQEFAPALSKGTGLPVEIVSYEKINFSPGILRQISDSNISLANVAGLGLRGIDESLNLAPQDIREKNRRFHRHREQLRIILFIVAIFLMLGVGTAKNLENKAEHLKRLKAELNKIANEAKSIERLAKRLEVFGARTKGKPTSLEAFYEIIKIVPNEVYLIDFSYEEPREVVLRGKARELNLILAFVSELEKSAVFADFNTKVRYATKRTTHAGEIIDFEINCLRK